MPDFSLTGKDGATYDITAPDAASAMKALTQMKGGAAPDAPPVNVAEDVAKSAGTGLARGVANIPGMAGDLPALADWGIGSLFDKAESLLGYKRTPEQQAAMEQGRSKAQTFRPPTSQDIRDAAAKVPGAIELHEPQTTAGKYAATAGEFATGAVASPVKSLTQLGGNILKRGVLPGLVSEGAGQAVQTLAPGNPLLETGARILGGAGAVGIPGYLGRNKGMRPPAPGVDPNQRIRMAKEFEVPLTEGQATGNITQQSFEEAARHGAKGPRATETMQQFGVRQRAAVDTAGGQMRERFQGNFAPVQGADVAGEQLAAAVKQQAADLRSASKAKIDQAELLNPTLDPGAAQTVVRDIEQRLKAVPFRFDEKLQPTAFSAMAEIDRLGGAPGVPANRLSGTQGTPALDVVSINQVRQRILSMKPINAADATALGHVKRAFDSWLDDAVDTQLFSGDPKGLDALKKHRQLWHQYRRITTPTKGDDASRVISNMATKNVTGQEVGNWLYGSSIVDPPATTVRVAQQIKGMFKQDSPEWSAIRQGAWTRVMQGSTAAEKGPQAISTAVNEFLNGKGKALAQALYSPEERELMRRYGQTVKFLVPDPKATNPSKSSYGMAKLAQKTLAGVGAMLGMTSHSDPYIGGTAGLVAGEVASRGVQAMQNASDAAATLRSVNPKLNAPVFDPARIAELAGRAGQAAAQPDRVDRRDERYPRGSNK